MTHSKHFAEKDIQTHLKHALLETYILRWGTILANTSFSKLNMKKIHFVDGFAGRGYFDDGKSGSPVIAMKLLFELQYKFESKFKSSDCKFIISTVEVHPEFQLDLDHIKGNSPNSDQIINYKGKFEDNLIPILKNTLGHPALFFIDPFGYKGVRMNDVRTILQQQSHEVLINVMSYSLVRNINIDQNSYELCKFFGVDKLPTNIADYIKIANNNNPLEFQQKQGIEKLEDSIIKLYRDQLSGNSDRPIYTLNKRIHSKINPNIYFHLVFATRNRKGLVAMKESMVLYENLKSEIEDEYMISHNIRVTMIGDLFSDEISLLTYTYDSFLKDFIAKFNNLDETVGNIADYFLQFSPLPYRDEANKQSIYDFLKRLVENRFISSTSTAFSDPSKLDNITVSARFPDGDTGEVEQIMLF